MRVGLSAGGFLRHRGLILAAAGGAVAEAGFLTLIAPAARPVAPAREDEDVAGAQLVRDLGEIALFQAPQIRGRSDRVEQGSLRRCRHGRLFENKTGKPGNAKTEKRFRTKPGYFLA